MIVFEKLQQVNEMIVQLDYDSFKNYYKMIALDLSKQQALDADRKAIQQINFTRNLAQDPIGNTKMFFHY